jgi:hypothetical protein
MPRLDDRTLAKEFDEAYRTAISVWSPWLAKAKKDIKFRLGDQWSWQDKAYLANQQRDKLVFNKVKRVVNLITGYQRKNRLAMKVDPVEGSDDKTASQFSGLLQACMTDGNGYQVASDAFEHGPVTTGMNLLELELDYSLDPVNGDMRINRVPYNALLLDPYFTERDLSDCNFILRRKWLSKDDLKAVFGDTAKEIDQMRPQGRDGKFPDSPPATNYQGNNLFRVDEFYRRTTKEAKLLVDKLTGEFKVFGGDKKRLDAFLRSPDEQTGFNMGERVEVQPHYIKTVDLAIMVEDVAFYDGQDLLGIDDYPQVALLGYWVPEYSEMKDKLQGVVRCMRDPQKETNRRRLKVLDIIDSVISTGFKAEEDSVVSPKSLYQTGQNRVVWTRKGMLDRVQQLSGGEAPASLFKIMEVMDGDIMELAGVEGLLQAPEQQNQQIAASLAKLREAQGLTVLQDLFDNLRLAKKLLGQKMIFAIQKNWAPAKVQRILNQQPSPEFYNRDFGRYDCVPCEGILTDTQRQMYFAQLLLLKQMGAPVSWATLIKASPLEVKEEILGEIQQAEQGQQQAAQMEMASKQVTEKLLQAETASRLAEAHGKTAKIKSDMAHAGLDMAKTMAEIQKMDASRIMSLLQMALELERQGGLGLPAPAPAPAPPQLPAPGGMGRDEILTRR